MKKIFIGFMIFCLFTQPSFCEVFMNYDVNVTPIPKLPQHLQNEKNISSDGFSFEKREKILLKKGTKLELKSLTDVSGYSKKGKKIQFQTTKSIYLNGGIIPEKTIIVGKIISSHPAQIAGNGALIKIELSELIFQNVSSDLQGKVISANSKKIFFNNIKGKRKYFKNMCSFNKFGVRTCKKSFKITSKWFNKGGLLTILSPIPVAGGIVVLTSNIIVSPVLSLFKKGENLTLKKGTIFSVKLTEDTYIYVFKPFK